CDCDQCAGSGAAAVVCVDSSAERDRAEGVAEVAGEGGDGGGGGERVRAAGVELSAASACLERPDRGAPEHGGVARADRGRGSGGRERCTVAVCGGDLDAQRVAD